MAANPIDIRVAISQVQSALVQTIDLAYRYRYPAVADLSALARSYLGDPEGSEAVVLPDRALVYVTSEGNVYRWRSAALDAPIAPYVVAPASFPALSAGNGRWFRESSSVTLGPAYFRPLHRVATGYALHVEIYQGEGDDEMLERIYAQRPSFLVEWIEDDLQVKSYMHGAIYEYDLRFVVHCLSQNFRPDASALLGSDVAELGEDGQPVRPDPGLYRMIGDLRYLLGGCQLGLAPGVKFVDVTGSARIVEKDLAQRVFRATLDVVVKGSVHVVDEDLFPDPQVWIQRQDAGTPQGQPFDAGNHLAQGYRLTPSPGLVQAPTQGVAYILGQLVTSTPGAHSFPPNMDTYRDLSPDGTLAYYAVDHDAEPPPQRPGTLRLGLTRTDASNVVADALLCSYAVDSAADPGDPFRAA